MNVAARISQFQSMGIRITTEGQDLVIKGPVPLTNEERTYLRANKATILEVLEYPVRWNPEMSTEGYIWCHDCRHFT